MQQTPPSTPPASELRVIGCGCGSISSAAHELYISQSSLSIAVKDIERECGVTVFKRSTKGIALTKEGSELLGYARQVVEQADLMEARYSKQAKPVTQHLSIAYPRYSFEQGSGDSFFFAEEPFAELPHEKKIIVSDRGTLSNLLAHHSGYTVSTGVLSSEMQASIVSIPLETSEKMVVGYIVHNERQLSPLASGYIETLKLFIEEYNKGFASL